MITDSPRTTGRATGNNVAGGGDTQAIGKRVLKVDGKEKVTGAAQYIGDLVMPGLLYAKVLRSTIPHGRIVKLDTSRAEKLRGVKGIVTGRDIPNRRWGMIIKDQTAMAIDRVRYYGEEVAAVAAISEEIAEAALDLIEVEYEELPAMLDMEAAFDNPVLIHDDKPRNVATSINLQRGSVEEGFAEADLIIEETFRTGYQFHGYIEPIGTLALYDQSDRLTVYCNTQSVWDTRHHLAAALDKSESEIRVIQPYVGGAFGGKVTDDNNVLVAALLAEKVRRPVRLLNTREDEFIASRPRMPSRLTLKMGFKNDGTITAKQSFIIMENGAFSARSPAVLGVTALRPDSIYRQKNIKIDAYLVYSNSIPTGSMRGFGGPQMTFAQESMMDIAARKLGIDPMEIRLRNATQVGDITVHGSNIRSCGLSDSIKLAGDLIGWEEPRLPNRGKGMANLIHVAGKRHFGDWDGSNAVITLNEHGQVLIHSGEGDIGQGANTGVCQIASEELGIPMEFVNITPADTDTTLYCHGVHASRIIYINGNAVRKAAQSVQAQLYETAADMLEASQDDLETRDGYISVKGSPDKRVFFKDVASTRLYRPQGTPIIGVPCGR
jgi:CO/xanthine dehydrogenase Mo-binding subunit